MKLLAYQISGQTIGVDIETWDNSIIGDNEPFIAIENGENIPNNYVDISSIINWDFYGILTGLNEGEIKQEIKNIQPSDLSDLSEEEMNIFGVLSISNNRFYQENNNSKTTTNSSLRIYDSLNVNLEEGIYELTIMFLFSINSTSKAFLYNVEVDGNNLYDDVDQFEHELKDKDNKQIITLTKDVYLTTGVHNIDLLYGSDGNSAATIYYSNMKLLKID